MSVCMPFFKRIDSFYNKYFATFYANLKMKYTSNVNYTFLFVQRRLALSFFIAFMTNSYSFSWIIIMIVNTFIQMFLLHFKPLKTRRLNFLESMNEFFIFYIAMVMVLLTDFSFNAKFSPE